MSRLFVLIDRLIDPWFFITCPGYLYWLIDWLISEYCWPVIVGCNGCFLRSGSVLCLQCFQGRAEMSEHVDSLQPNSIFSQISARKEIIFTLSSQEKSNFSSEFYKKKKICKKFHANILTARWLPRFLGTLPDPSRLACSSWGTWHAVARLCQPNKPITYTWPKLILGNPRGQNTTSLTTSAVLGLRQRSPALVRSGRCPPCTWWNIQTDKDPCTIVLKDDIYTIKCSRKRRESLQFRAPEARKTYRMVKLASPLKAPVSIRRRPLLEMTLIEPTKSSQFIVNSLSYFDKLRLILGVLMINTHALNNWTIERSSCFRGIKFARTFRWDSGTERRRLREVWQCCCGVGSYFHQ